jgi:REP element-mobilizing transposase RayT
MSSYPTRRHHRLSSYDYSTTGFYFVTLCIQDRLPLLGIVASGEMIHSSGGALVSESCEKICDRSPGILLDTLMIMPDHLHAILSLTGELRSLSEVIHHLKSRTTAQYARGVRCSNWPPFHGKLWQQGFYDRVIRDDRELAAIRAYVGQNPLRWSLKEQGL